MGVKVRQRKKGKNKPWYIFITHNGKRRSRKIGDKTTALKIAKQVELKLAQHDFKLEKEKPLPTFGEYSQKWLNNYVKVSCRESTFDEYDSILKVHLLPVFKDTRLNDISRGAIRDFLLVKIKTGLSRARVNSLKDVLSGILGYALDEELIIANPTFGITKRLWPKNNKQKVSKDVVYNKEEIELFLKTCKETAPNYYALFTTLIKTGMRIGEASALRWEDIDYNSNFLCIRRSYRRGIFNKPKNGKSRRVDMTPQLQAVLKQQQKKDIKDCFSWGVEQEFVFNKYTRPIEQSFMRDVYKKVLKKAGLRYIKLHGLRHAFASILLSEGASLFYVSKQLGHSSINITSNVYGHFIATEGNRAVDLLDFVAPKTHQNALKAIKMG